MEITFKVAFGSSILASVLLVAALPAVVQAQAGVSTTRVESNSGVTRSRSAGARQRYESFWLSDELGHMPIDSPRWKQLVEVDASRNLAALIGVRSAVAMPDAGPQAFEVYQYIAHQAGTQRLALGIISNTELAGDGDVVEARGIGSGLIQTGAGRVGTWVAFEARCASPASPETVCVALDMNGWRFVVLEDRLELIRPDGSLAAAY